MRDKMRITGIGFVKRIPLIIMVICIAVGLQSGTDKGTMTVYADDGDISPGTLIDFVGTMTFYLYEDKAKAGDYSEDYCVTKRHAGGKILVPSSVGGYDVYAWRPCSSTEYYAVLESEFRYFPGEGTGETLYQYHYKTINSTSTVQSFTFPSTADFVRPNYKLSGWTTGDGNNFNLGSTILFPGITTEAVFTAWWVEKADSSVSVAVNGPIYEGDPLADKISVEKVWQTELSL